jgi:hypothetical protein
VISWFQAFAFKWVSSCRCVEAKLKMGATMKASAFALTEAKYVAGEGIKHNILAGLALLGQFDI